MPPGKTREIAVTGHSFRLLEEAIECFTTKGLRAVINLGDLVNSNEPTHVDSVMAVLEKSIHLFIHVLGTHGFLGPVRRRDIQSGLGMTGPWGKRLRRGSWRVIVVDSQRMPQALFISSQFRRFVIPSGICDSLGELERIQ